MPDSEDQTNSEGDAYSELARQRRELAERESARPRPDFIQSVEHSEVLYYFTPARSGIPFEFIDVQAVTEKLLSKYKVRLDGPDFSPLLADIPREKLAEMSEDELLVRLVRNTDSRLQWSSGRFPLRDDFIQIKTISVNWESILVAVGGVSSVAEVIAKEVIELIWELAGSKKKFSDVEKYVTLVAYGTATRLELGYGAECLLNPALMSFLDKNLAEGKKYAASMGRVKMGKIPRSSTGLFALAALDDLTLRVNRFDPTTGNTESNDIQFSITAQSDYRTGRLRVSSTMPFEKHVELLTDLFQVVQPQDDALDNSGSN